MATEDQDVGVEQGGRERLAGSERGLEEIKIGFQQRGWEEVAPPSNPDDLSRQLAANRQQGYEVMEFDERVWRRIPQDSPTVRNEDGELVPPPKVVLLSEEYRKMIPPVEDQKKVQFPYQGPLQPDNTGCQTQYPKPAPVVEERNFATEDPSTTKRRQFLDDVKECICKNRANIHGPPEDSFQTIADIVNAVIPRLKLSSQEVGILMICLKVARLRSSPNHRDNYIDIAGYSGCTSVIAETNNEGKP